MKSQDEEAYKWLPTLGEWYRVDGSVWFFKNLTNLKEFYKGVNNGWPNRDKDKSQQLATGTWILITNITLGNDPEPAYLEFLIRKDQYEQSEDHAQKIFFLGMYPRLPFNPEDERWTKVLAKVKER